MYPLTPAAFLALADGNVTVTSRITAYARAQGRLPDIDAWTDWTVDYDATSPIYAKGKATFIDPSLWTGEWFDPLSPWGSELTIERGIVLVDDAGDERTEWIPMGRFVITDVEDALPLATGAIEVTLADRATHIADNPWDDTVSTSPAEGFVAAIERIMRECPPLAGVEFVDLSGLANNSYYPTADLGTDRLEAIHKLARAINCEFFFDRLGRALLRPIRFATSGTPDWEITDTTTFLSAKRTATRQKTFSRVYVEQEVKGSGDDAPDPITATSTDLDPASPTYHPRFGRSRTYRSPLIVWDVQAQQIADSIRLLSREAGQTVEVSHVPMEALDRGDLVRIVPDRYGATEQRQIVQSFSVGALVTAGPQTLGARGVELPSESDDSLLADVARSIDDSV